MSKKKTTSKQMPFWGHIYELRRRLFIIIAALLIFSFAGYYIFPYIVKILIALLKEELYASDITEGFTLRLKFSFILGAILTIPIFLFELILFIIPALKKQEKIILLITTTCAFILFIAGVIFSYKVVMPYSIAFLKSEVFFPENIKRIISYEKFLIFFFQFLLAFGLCFQFPIILIVLLKLGIIKFSFLTKNIKYFIVAIFIIAAILTPPDVQSQIFMAVPLLGLYFLTILIAKIFKIGV